MKVWIVIFGWSYEGENANSTEVFLDEDKARARAKDLGDYDYARVIDREVIA